MVVLAWDAAALAIVSSSLHSFDSKQLPTGGRTLFPRPEITRAEPSGRCAAVLLLKSYLAVLPAVDASAKLGIACVAGAAAVGNSFVIDLASMGIKTVRDFVFLHKCGSDALVVLLFLPGASVYPQRQQYCVQ